MALRRARPDVADDEAFLEAALPQLDMLHTLARNLTRTREDAEDIVQDVMLKAFRSWTSTAPPRSMPAWLATICVNTVHSSGRRLQARPRECHDDAELERLPALSDTAVQALARVEADVVRAALARLSAGQRETITLINLCGCSTDEVARMLGVPRGTVLSRLHRGHQRLAADLSTRITR